MPTPSGSQPLLGRVLRTLKSDSISSAIVFGLGGVGFSLATLLLARFLSADEFGLLALILALIQIGIAVGPAGMDLLINREHLSPGGRIARRVSATSIMAGTVTALVAVLVYHAPTNLAPLIAVGVTAATFSKVGAAFFQSRQQFKLSLALTQGHNFVLLIAVPLAAYFRTDALLYILALIAIAYVATAMYGWLSARRRFPVSHVEATPSWIEGLHGMGIVIAVLVLAQTERILVPLLLSLEEMARFGVLAAVVIAPFRMLQLAIGYTLLPRLRKADSLIESQQILRSEAAIAVKVGLAGAVAVYWLGPIAIQVLTGGKYTLPSSLFIAAIGIGWIRLVQSILVTIVNSLGDRRLLRTLNVVGWLSLVVATAAAWWLAQHGLIGILLGVGMGWACQAVIACFLAGRALSVYYRHRGDDADPQESTG